MANDLPTEKGRSAPGMDASGGRTSSDHKPASKGNVLAPGMRKPVHGGPLKLSSFVPPNEGAGDSVGELVSRVREPLSPQELHDPGAHFWLSVFLVECSWGA